MKKIAVIPARSGSKGLKDKNIINFCGKPMMNYSIEAAIGSCCFDRIIVSTDSADYGQIAVEAGAEVVYRGEKVSDDTATTYMVIEDLFSKIVMDFDYFVLLQPTSPLRNSNHIREAVNLFETHIEDFDFLVSVKEAEHAKILVNSIDDDQSLKYFDTDFANYRRQAFKDYSPNGSIFIAKPEAYLEKKHFFGPRAIAYKMNSFDSIDVDTELDYKFAGLCMEERLKGRY